MSPARGRTSSTVLSVLGHVVNHTGTPRSSRFRSRTGKISRLRSVAVLADNLRFEAFSGLAARPRTRRSSPAESSSASSSSGKISPCPGERHLAAAGGGPSQERQRPRLSVEERFDNRDEVRADGCSPQDEAEVVRLYHLKERATTRRAHMSIPENSIGPTQPGLPRCVRRWVRRRSIRGIYSADSAWPFFASQKTHGLGLQLSFRSSQS